MGFDHLFLPNFWAQIRNQPFSASIKMPSQLVRFGMTLLKIFSEELISNELSSRLKILISSG